MAIGSKFPVHRCVLLCCVLLTSRCARAQDVDATAFTQSLRETAGSLMKIWSIQDHFNSLEYATDNATEWRPSAGNLAENLAQQTANLLQIQKKALQLISDRVEQLYNGEEFTARPDVQECCNLNITETNYNFNVPISKEYSCDRLSSAISADYIHGKLDRLYRDNDEPPLKWQYFGSEQGVVNQFPAVNSPNCSFYDNRLRPWYRVAATPDPKDVVIILKNNLFLSKRSRTVLFLAAKIILRTLNPRDRVAMVLYNHDVIMPALGGCYATNLSLATPANLHKLNNFLRTAPEPQSGNDMLEALSVAYQFFRAEDVPQQSSNGRRRAVVLFTDEERLDSIVTETAVKNLVQNSTSMLNTTIFIFAATEYGDLPQNTFLSNLVITSGRLQLLDTRLDTDLRRELAEFYSQFATMAQEQYSGEFSPVYLPPYFDVFGLDRLVLTLSTPCFRNSNLIGVAAIDLTLADVLAGVEYFRKGEFSYAFVVDSDGLAIYHPLLPFPSSTDSAVYLDIATLEPHPGFENVRDSMLSGGTGCMELNSTHVLSRGGEAYDGAQTVLVTSQYCYAKISETPFSLCVVMQADAISIQPLLSSLSPPISAHYHRLDVLADDKELCSYGGLLVSRDYSSVVMSPDAYVRPGQYIAQEESENRIHYLQSALRTLQDSKQILVRGVLESVASTAIVDSVWVNDNASADQAIWRYIATGNGVLRIYPAVQIGTKEFSVPLRPWYQRAVGLRGRLAITPPYIDELGFGSIVTLSKAIFPKECQSNVDISDPSCPVLAVVGMDLSVDYIARQLRERLATCADVKNYRCVLIESNGYVISHPSFLEQDNHNISAAHLAQLEPHVARDMLGSGYFQSSYCNSFQYNENFTKRPRQQKSYSVTDKVVKATEALDGGYSTYCIFYEIAPIEQTNTFLIVINKRQSAQSLCPPLTCSCDPDQPCSHLPSACTCPCYEEIPDTQYNSCLESFTGLSAPACPSRFGFDRVNISLVTFTRADPAHPLCFTPNCTAHHLEPDCKNTKGCQFCPHRHANGSTLLGCTHEASCEAPPNFTGPSDNSTSSEVADATAVWKAITGLFLGLTVVLAVALFTVLFFFLCLHWRRSLLFTSAASKSDRSLPGPGNPSELESVSSTLSKDASEVRGTSHCSSGSSSSIKPLLPKGGGGGRGGGGGGCSTSVGDSVLPPVEMSAVNFTHSNFDPYDYAPTDDPAPPSDAGSRSHATAQDSPSRRLHGFHDNEEHLSPIPESFQTDTDTVFMSDQGNSLNKSHAGGVWF